MSNAQILSPSLKNSALQQMTKKETSKMQLVPCRWQKSGWKYVEVDPSTTHFFGSPNRANSHGFGPNQKPRVNA